METQLRILLLEDSVDDVELIEHQLKKGDFSYNLKVVDNRIDYESSLKNFLPDVILSDHSLPMFDSKLALQMFHSFRKIYNPVAVFVLVTGTVSEEFAVQIMKEGADDYILKDRLRRLPGAIQNAVEKAEHKEHQRKAQEEKLYMFDVLQKSLHEIYVMNPDTFKFEYVNEEASKNLGYSLKELKEMTPADIIKDFNKQRFQNAVELTAASKKGLIFERTAVRKDKTLYPIQIHLQVIGIGEKKKILANVLDITEAKTLEMEKELGDFIQNSFTYKRNLRESLEMVLRRVCESFSCIASEVFSKEFDQLGSKVLASYNTITTNGTKTGRKLSEKVYKSGSREVINFQRKILNEEDKNWMEKSGVRSAVALPVYLGTDLIAVIVGFLPDLAPDLTKFAILTENVQQKLAGNIKRMRSEEELQKIFDFSPDIITVLGKDGYIRKINPAIKKVLGYSAEEIMSKPFDSLIHPDDIEILEKWRDKELKENEIANYESRWLTKEGEYKCFAWSVTPYMKGELHFAVGRDISDSKKQLNAIQEQNKKLAEIAWKQSHEVRAPLTRLLSCVEYLIENTEHPNDLLGNIKNSAYEIDGIVKSIIHNTEKVEWNEES